jgi:hypothetical protein
MQPDAVKLSKVDAEVVARIHPHAASRVDHGLHELHVGLYQLSIGGCAEIRARARDLPAHERRAVRGGLDGDHHDGDTPAFLIWVAKVLRPAGTWEQSASVISTMMGFAVRPAMGACPICW